MISRQTRRAGWVRVRDVAASSSGPAQGYDRPLHSRGRPPRPIGLSAPRLQCLDTRRSSSRDKRRRELKDGAPRVDYDIVTTHAFIFESVARCLDLRDAVSGRFVVLLFSRKWRSAVIFPRCRRTRGHRRNVPSWRALGFSLKPTCDVRIGAGIGCRAIVVDDAIVRVEAVRAHIVEHRLGPERGHDQAMNQVTARHRRRVGPHRRGHPCAFITGITGQFYRQFALTIATRTV